MSGAVSFFFFPFCGAGVVDDSWSRMEESRDTTADCLLPVGVVAIVNFVYLDCVLQGRGRWSSVAEEGIFRRRMIKNNTTETKEGTRHDSATVSSRHPAGISRRRTCRR
jgi:hypothetical protein